MAIAARRRAFNIVVTNVPGPRRPIRLMGGTLDSLVAFAPLFPGQRISVALVECAGRLSVGLTDGWSGRDPGRRFAQDLEDEITGVLDFV
jgi:diacylglycerol O-acyltransferase